jgi:hypothetical protein
LDSFTSIFNSATSHTPTIPLKRVKKKKRKKRYTCILVSSLISLLFMKTGNYMASFAKGSDWDVYGTGTVDCKMGGVDCKMGGRAAVLWWDPRRKC